jgi:hypothetical protein
MIIDICIVGITAFIPAKWFKGTTSDGFIFGLLVALISLLLFNFQLVSSAFSLGGFALIITIIAYCLPYTLVGYLGSLVGVKRHK